MSRNKKLSPCPECCPAPGRADFVRHSDIDDETGDWVSFWECYNCGYRKPLGHSPKRTLPENPTMDDLTKSQRRSVLRIKHSYDYLSGDWILRGGGRKVYVAYRAKHAFDFNHLHFVIGTHGGVHDLTKEVEADLRYARRPLETK